MPFGLGYTEMLIVGLLAVMLFGNRLPSVARSLGRSLTEFKQGMSGIQSEWNDAIYAEPSDAIEHTDRQQPAGDPFAPPPAAEQQESTEDPKAPASQAAP